MKKIVIISSRNISTERIQVRGNFSSLHQLALCLPSSQPWLLDIALSRAWTMPYIMECLAGCIVPQQQLTPAQLTVDDLFNNIYIEGRAGAKVTSLTQAVDLAGSRRPNVVLFIIITGSNDLCDLGADPGQVATDLLSLMDYLNTAYDIPLVMCCGVVPHDRCRQIMAEEFLSRARIFNEWLHHGCTPGSARKYVTMKGFWNDGQGHPLPVSQ